ncbi:hypothetical protein CTI12_AA312740 [Artemisia annua]|uniref:Uncharacterized protein n=1 Tax=Artemisia annua TaxID=35608 RepID=A0A2U1N322_ARTAN|nr:hypothetical protein CTI12_AA312740 [Artemisia annua]
MNLSGASKSNEHHVAEIGSARETAKEDVSKNSKDIIKHMEVISQEEQEGEFTQPFLKPPHLEQPISTLLINESTMGEFTQPFLKPPHLEQPISTLLINESTMVFGRTLISDNDGNYKGPLMLPLKEGNSMVIVGQAICPVQPWYS